MNIVAVGYIRWPLSDMLSIEDLTVWF